MIKKKKKKYSSGIQVEISDYLPGRKSQGFRSLHKNLVSKINEAIAILFC